MPISLGPLLNSCAGIIVSNILGSQSRFALEFFVCLLHWTTASLSRASESMILPMPHLYTFVTAPFIKLVLPFLEVCFLHYSGIFLKWAIVSHSSPLANHLSSIQAGQISRSFHWLCKPRAWSLTKIETILHKGGFLKTAHRAWVSKPV